MAAPAMVGMAAASRGPAAAAVVVARVAETAGAEEGSRTEEADLGTVQCHTAHVCASRERHNGCRCRGRLPRTPGMHIRCSRHLPSAA
eukprot:6060179-Prymnesium_polylepis.1